MRPILLLVLALTIGANAKDPSILGFEKADDLEGFWIGWWKEMSEAPLRVPKTEPVDPAQVTRNYTGTFTAGGFRQGERFEEYFALRRNHRLKAWGETADEGKWKANGRWTTHKGKVFLLLKGDTVPSIIFKHAGKLYITDPFADEGLSQFLSLEQNPGQAEPKQKKRGAEQ